MLNSNVPTLPPTLRTQLIDTNVISEARNEEKVNPGALTFSKKVAERGEQFPLRPKGGRWSPETPATSRLPA